MPYLIESTHTRTIYKSGLTLPEAVLEAARFDGWGAGFCRDSDGVMALRLSTAPTDNFAPTGDEYPAFAEISSNPDDEEAILEVCTEIEKSRWGGHMQHLRIWEHALWCEHVMLQEFEHFFGDRDTGPGTWIVDRRGGEAMLVYRWPDDYDFEPVSGDEPWKDWGGLDFLGACGLKVVEGFMQDGYDHAIVDVL